MVLCSFVFSCFYFQVLLIHKRLCLFIDTKDALQVSEDEANQYFADITQLIALLQNLGHCSKGEQVKLLTEVYQVNKTGDRPLVTSDNINISFLY